VKKFGGRSRVKILAKQIFGRSTGAAEQMLVEKLTAAESVG